MPDDKNLKSVYETLQREGYTPPEYEQFAKDMSDDKNLKGVYETLQREGYTPPEYDQFKIDMGFAKQPHPADPNFDLGGGIAQVMNGNGKTNSQPQVAQQQPQPKPAAQQEQQQPQPKPAVKPAQQPMTQEQRAANDARVAQLNAGAQKVLTQVKNIGRLYDQFTPEGRKKIGMAKAVARMHGRSTYLPGISTQPKPDEKTDIGGGEQADIHPISTFSPQPYGTVYEDGKEKTQWLMPDGSLTTDIVAANEAEHQARIGRDIYRFEERMRKNNLNPDSPEDRATQQADDMIAEIDKRLNSEAPQAKAKRGGEATSLFQNSLGNYATESKAYEGVNALATARRALLDSKAMIAEAKKARTEGNEGFFLGAARGFGNKVFDTRTWDMGITDSEDLVSLTKALKASEQGKSLTPDQQTLLDAKALELATQAMTHSSIGYGYEAGQVFGESLPFMLEMMLNPMSGVGKSSQAMLTRYALKKFGKETLKRQSKKYLASKIGARILGDAIGAAGMSATTGLMRVGADARQRTNGDIDYTTDQKGHVRFNGVQEDTKEDSLTAFTKAFVSNTIENHSEMVGEYFTPLLQTAGKGVGKLMAKGMSKEHYQRFIDFLVNANPYNTERELGKLLKKAKFEGPIPEYCEEVVGNIENALTVGDMTLDSQDNTGAFNPDLNLRTFLGVAVSGGVFSVIGAASYRTPRYRQRKAMEDADEKALRAFGSADRWGQIRNTLAFGSDEEKVTTLRQMLEDKNLSQQQKRAAIRYAKETQKYKGILLGEEKKQQDGNPSREQTELEANYSNGYTLDTPQQMSDARNWLLYHLEQLRDKFGLKEGEEDQFIQQMGADPVTALNAIRQNYTPEQAQTAASYLNAKAQWDGMIDHVKDDIDSQIERANSDIDLRTNQQSGQIQPLTIRTTYRNEQVERTAYLLSGNLAVRDDGSIDTEASDNTLVIRDETGKLQMLNPSKIISMGQALNPLDEKARIAGETRPQLAQQAADTIDGRVDYTPGNQYNIIDENGQPHTITIASHIDENGNILAMPPLDDQCYVIIDGGEMQLMQKDDLQQSVDAFGLSNAAQHDQEQQEQEQAAQQAEAQNGTAATRTFQQGDEFDITDDHGNSIHVELGTYDPTEHTFEVVTDKPLAGQRVQPMTTQQLNDLFPQEQETTQNSQETTQTDDTAPADGNNAVENIPENGNIEGNNIPDNEPMEDTSEFPTLDNGEPDYSQATPQRTRDYFYNENELTREEADQLVANNLAQAEKDLAEVQSHAPKPALSPTQFRAQKEQHAQKVAEAQAVVDYWNAVKAAQQAVLDEEALQAEAEALNHIDAGENANERTRYIQQARTRKDLEARAKQVYGSLLGELEPQTLEEFVSTHIAPRSINWEGREVNGVRQRGLQQEIGGKRGIGSNYDSTPFNIFLAAKGKGISIDQLVHNIWEDRESFDPNLQTDEIRTAVLDLFMTAQRPSDISNLILNNRIQQAEALMRAQEEDYEQHAAEERQRQEQEEIDNQIAQQAMQGYVTPEEQEAIMQEAFEAAAEQFHLTDEQHNELMSIFADEWNNIDNINNTDNEQSTTANAGSAEVDTDHPSQPVHQPSQESQGNLPAEQPAQPLAREVNTQQREEDRPAAQHGSRHSDTDTILPLEEETGSRGREQEATDGGNGLRNNDRGTGEGHSDERKSNLAQTEEIDYQLSDEVDENGHQFVLTSTGEIAFGNIDEETGLAPAPILLSEGTITNSKTKAGYGLVHIEARHGDEIRKAGYPNVVAFVEEVAKHYDVIKEGINRAGEQTYMLQLTDSHNNTLMVELSGDGTYYNINTAGIFKTSYGRNRKEVYNRHTTANQPTESGEASQGEAQSGTTSPSRMNATAPSSDGKETQSAENKQENEQEKSISNENASLPPAENTRNATSTEQTQTPQDTFVAPVRKKDETLSDYNERVSDARETWIAGHLHPELTPQRIAIFESGDKKAIEQVKKEVYADLEKYFQITTPHGTDWRFRHIANSARRARQDATPDSGLYKFSNYVEWAANNLRSKYDFMTEAKRKKARLESIDSDIDRLMERAILAGRQSDAEVQEYMRQKEQAEKQSEKPKYIVSDDRMAELRKRILSKFGQLNMGVDPELLILGAELAIGHIERGARAFGDYAKAMIADLGDFARPYLKAFYNSVRDMPEAQGFAEEMTPYEEVRKFNVATIGKDGENTQPPILDTAEQIANENKVERDANDINVVVSKEENTTSDRYTITPAQYTTRKGKVLDMFLVTPSEELGAFDYRDANALAREMRGWWDNTAKGFMLRSEEDARTFAEKTFGTPIGKTSSADEMQSERDAVNTQPTDAQKAAGNYAKGHINVDGYDITIENPKGSTRSGKDANGKEWSIEMKHDYGYIRGTEGVDGDHIDVYLSDNPTSGKVYVVDQINQQDGSFDEHKVMYGFNSMEEAVQAYRDQYEDGWKVGKVTEVSREDFKKWVESSHRKTKPFAEYAAFKSQADNADGNNNETFGKHISGEDAPSKKNSEPATSKPRDRHIQDYGEVIAGARKNALTEFAKSITDINIETLITQPLNKVWKKPNLKKMVADKAITEEEATFLEAIAQWIAQDKKPSALKSGNWRKSRRETEIRQWAENTYQKMTVFKQFVEGTDEERATMLETGQKLNYPNAELERKAIEKIKDLNRHRYEDPEKVFAEWGKCLTPNPLYVYMQILKGMGYEAGDKVSYPVFNIIRSTSGDYYEAAGSDGKRSVILPTTKDVDEMIANIVAINKVMRGDSDAQIPESLLRPRVITYKTVGNGTFTVLKMTKFGGVSNKEFNNRDEAESYAAKTGGILREETKSVPDQWSIGFTDLNGDKTEAAQATKGEGGETTIVGDHFDSKEEAIQALKEDSDRYSDIILQQYRKEHASNQDENAQKERKFNLYYRPGGVAYMLSPKDAGDWKIISPVFKTQKEAKKWMDEHRAEVEAQVDMLKEKMKEHVYFTDEAPRVGKDWRNGRDITPEEFGKTFGFRGVQFGNWANDADRQAALNNGYDSLMDMAELMGISPSAVSLNGELGIAFGARGTGRANAHYELREVVINLTKTRGAGSLAHEWWHALDNYFSRMAGLPFGMVTSPNSNNEIRKKNIVRSEVMDAYDKVVKAIWESSYGQRQAKNPSSYWKDPVEMSARLLDAWVGKSFSDSGQHNGFLTHAYTPEYAETYRKAMYEAQKGLDKLTGDETVPYEEFRNTPEALGLYENPSREEMEELAPVMRNFFDTLEEKVGEDGNSILFRDGDETPSEHKDAQLSVINKHNPMLDDYHTGIRKVEDIKTFDEVVDAARNGDWAEYGEFAYPDITIDMLEDAQKTGMITVYSSKPIGQGVFVTPSKINATDYAGDGKVYSKEVPVEDVAWISEEEGQYAKVQQDDDLRFRFIGEKGAANADRAEEATTRLDNLGVARQMETDGKNAKAIKIATGWERGADGMWRYEEADEIKGAIASLLTAREKKSKALQRKQEKAMKAAEKLRNSVADASEQSRVLAEADKLEQEVTDAMDERSTLYRKYTTTLADMLGHDHLILREYPSLKDINIVYKDLGGDIGHGFTQGEFDNATRTLTINDRTTQQLGEEGISLYGKMDAHALQKLHARVSMLMRVQSGRSSRDETYKKAGEELKAIFKNLKKLSDGIVTSEYTLDKALQQLKNYEKYGEKGESVLIHELQHAIQYIEGFARGGSASSVRKAIEEDLEDRFPDAEWAEEKGKVLTELKYREFQLEWAKKYASAPEKYVDDTFVIALIAKNSGKEFDEIEAMSHDEKIDAIKRLARDWWWEVVDAFGQGDNPYFGMKLPKSPYPEDRSEIPDAELDRINEEAWSVPHSDEMREAINARVDAINNEIEDFISKDELNEYRRYKKMLDNKNDFQLYKALAGEVESRNVQSRMNMTDEQRRKTLASETEDVSRKDQLFLFYELGPEMSEDSNFTENREKRDRERYGEGYDSLSEVKQKNVSDYFNIQDEIDARGVVSIPKEVNVVKAKPHPFNTQQKTAALKAEVVDYAEKNGIIGTMTNRDTNGKGEINISKKSISKFVDDSASDKSVGKDIHLSVLPVIRDVIRESFEGEVHPDVTKEKGKRELGNAVNKDVIMHRFFGAVNIDGTTYRVKITAKEYRNRDTQKAYSYEVTNIEVPSGKTQRGDETRLPRLDTSIETAKLLKDVDKSYEKGKKLLNASEKSAESPQKDMADRAQEIADDLNTPIRLITDENEIAGLDSVRKRGAKGWTTLNTGEVVIIVPNNTDVADIANTTFHEIVAHRGLRALVGEENMDNMLDEIYGHAEGRIRETIDRRVDKMVANEVERLVKKKNAEADRPNSRNGIFSRAEAIIEAEQKRERFRREATEEYMADMAGRIGAEGFEKMDAEEQTFWGKVKAKVMSLINRLLKGKKWAKNVTITDNDIAYILYRSWKNLRNGGKPTVAEMAEDVVMRERTAYNNNVSAEEESRLLFRTDDSGGLPPATDEATRIYEEGVAKTFLHTLDESYHDYLRSVKVLQDAIAKASGRAIDDISNVYLKAIHKSSEDRAEWDKMMHDLALPLTESLATVIGRHRKFRGDPLTKETVETYLNCKHGLERNDRWAMRDAENARDKKLKSAKSARDAAIHNAERNYKQTVSKAADSLRNGTLSQADYDTIKQKADADQQKAVQDATDGYSAQEAAASAEVEKNYRENRKKDYSGLTDIFDPDGTKQMSNADLEDEARLYILDFENIIPAEELEDLWDKIHAINDYSLEKSFRSGLISKKQLDDTRTQFSYYVPLRGFKQTVASDVYDYITHGGTPLNRVTRHGSGRTSQAADIIATMMNLAHSAIVDGNKNLMKQALLNLALQNEDTDLLSVSNQWYEQDRHGNWTPSDGPEINDSMTARQMRDAITQYEEEMEQKEEQGTAMRKKRGVELRVKLDGKEKQSEHGVKVLRNGREFVVYVNGNPRAAQAINGLLNPDSQGHNPFYDAWMNFHRLMSALFTSFSPNFLGNNIKRDLSGATFYMTSKYGHQRAATFLKHATLNTLGTNSKQTASPYAFLFAGLRSLYKKYQQGTLNESNNRERWFREFLENGGETGYSNLWNVEQYDKEVDNLLKAKTAKGRIKKAFQFYLHGIENNNRAVENICRFAAYCAGRENGLSVLKSIEDAKECSVNFNRKGSGDFGARQLRSVFLFVNPAIQGLCQHFQLIRNYPKKAIPLVAADIALGMLIPMFNQLLIPALLAATGAGGGDDGDDEETRDDYWNIASYTRRSAMMIRIGKNSYIKWDIPQEKRIWYGLGEILYSAMTGKLDHENLSLALLSQISQAMVIDPVNVESILDPEENLVFGITKKLGNATPISTYSNALLADEDFTGRQITGRTVFNEQEPEYKRAGFRTSNLAISASRWLNNHTGGNDHKKGTVDINPSTAEYIITNSLGGVTSFAGQVYRIIDNAFFEEDGEITSRDIPLYGTFYTNTDNSYNKSLRSNIEYKWYKHEYDATENEINGWRRDLDSQKIDITQFAEKITDLSKTDRYKRWWLIYSMKFPDSVSNAYKAGDTDRANDTKAEMVRILHNFDNSEDHDGGYSDTWAKRFIDNKGDKRKTNKQMKYIIANDDGQDD